MPPSSLPVAAGDLWPLVRSHITLISASAFVLLPSLCVSSKDTRHWIWGPP